MTKNEFLECLHGTDFSGLFIENGWSNPSSKAPMKICIGEDDYSFVEVAQQKGFRVLACKVPHIPDASVRRALDAKIRKLYQDYIAIFASTGEPFHQLWSVPVKTVDKRQLVTVEYDKDDQATFLLEKMGAIAFSFDENPTIIDVANRVNSAFLVNTTEVTKKFYQCFRKEHEKFVKGIENVVGKEDREWYASVMLNRLMFCYFIQKKRFLNFDENYLGNKLRETQARKGKDKFYESFYRSFLKQLFSDGLDKPVAARSDYFIKKYGRIPYLNGGMFSMHQIEKENKDIDIPDRVFEHLFAFFDQWHWHLDNRITASGRDINPDVLGYIFEQYINDRAQMGAYYTKEDITEYIGRNTIIPWVWIKAVGKRDIGEFLGGSRSCATATDRYIFPAMRKGIDLPLPPEIEKGVPVEPQSTLRARRANWNKPADEKYALPTEIWRETVARRQRCEEIRAILGMGTRPACPSAAANGRAGAPRTPQPLTIHDFITYNLDIRTFVEDVIRDTSDHKLVLNFYNALREVTVLDPTCGSGAFLFAALNILEPLYEACLDRMEEFHAKNPNLFKDELEEIKGKFRSNQKYFIYKNIILRNLYGVDIMHEATEIARLRLFLKMVAVVDVDECDPNLGLDPLPDIDFNIRCGNTLVGFTSPQAVKDAILPPDELHLDQSLYDAVEATAKIVADDYSRFKALQQAYGDNAAFRQVKKQLRNRLGELNDELDHAMAQRIYGINPTTLRGNKEFQEWKKRAQPFHWFSEFYSIVVARGGFDVIIGNPPYVEYSKVKDYKITGYKTESCGNLYAFVIERSRTIQSTSGKGGMIIPLSGFSTPRMLALEKLFVTGAWISSYDFRPAKLFEGVNLRLAISLWDSSREQPFSTKYNRWHAETRSALFETLHYEPSCWLEVLSSFPKFSNTVEEIIFTKIFSDSPDTGEVQSGHQFLYYHDAILYWLRGTNFEPSYNGYLSSHVKTIAFHDREILVSALAKFNSTLFYWFWTIVSNCRDLSIDPFYHLVPPSFSKRLEKAVSLLMQDFRANSKICERNQRATGLVRYREFYPKLSKPIIDEIDELLAKHYGFTEEELDFIINYDIKYRMGDELNAW